MKKFLVVLSMIFVFVDLVFANDINYQNVAVDTNASQISDAQVNSSVNCNQQVQQNYDPNTGYLVTPNSQYPNYYSYYGTPVYGAQVQPAINSYSAYSQQVGGIAYNAYQTTQRYIDDGLKENKAVIVQSASALTMAQKSTLYENNMKSTMAGFCLNFFLGFGIGSFVQGDMVAGSICLCGDLIGIACMLGGAYMVGGNKTYYDYSLGSYTVDSGYLTMGIIVLSIGGAIGLAARIYEWIAPFTYAKSYNRELSEAIFGSDTNAVLTTNVYPAVASNGNVGWSAAAAVSF